MARSLRMGRGRKRPQQGAVRRNQLNQKLKEKDEEMGQKVAQSLAEYHRQFVEPLEQEVAWLRLPWWVRAWRRVVGWMKTPV